MIVTSSDNFEVREQTLLTPHGVASIRSFLDWDSQPSIFKHYPHFCYRVPLCDHPSLQWLRETRCISDEQRIAHKQYHRLNVPSAGNLHPIEIYVQIRNVAGLLSGIYHLDALSDELVMIIEIGSEGIEPLLGLDRRFSGCIVMLSLVPFRSSWKYGLRAWRYLYLDLGHQIGVLSASVEHFGLHLTKMFTDNLDSLNRLMGMGEDERIVALYGVGEMSERPVKLRKEPLMKVQPTDYTISNDMLVTSVKNSPLYNDIPTGILWENFITLNRTRRSAREFYPHAMKDGVIEALLQRSAPPSLEVVAILLQAHSMQPGVYRNAQLSTAGNYHTEVVHLLLEQRFIASATVVLLIYAEHFGAITHIEAGIYAQELYLACEELGIGCSGIGAFYDEEASRWSDNALLYAVAIGGKL